MSSDDSESISSDKLASSDDNTENNSSNSFGLPTTKTVLSDHRQFGHTQHERLYKLPYFSHLKNTFLCKICTVFYGDIPYPEHTSWGTWSHKEVVFKENPSKKLLRHGESKSHKKAILAKANLSNGESIASKNNKDWAHANKLYINKLVQIVHFLSRDNVAVNRLYPKFIELLSSELQEPIIKQYLDACAKNATYISHETCDSLIHSPDNYFVAKSNERIKKCDDTVLYADESMSVARKEMLGIFLAIFDEMKKKKKK